MSSSRSCKKCGSIELKCQPNAKNPKHTELICAKCGAWQKFLNKDEKRLFQFKGELNEQV